MEQSNPNWWQSIKTFVSNWYEQIATQRFFFEHKNILAIGILFLIFLPLFVLFLSWQTPSSSPKDIPSLITTSLPQLTSGQKQASLSGIIRVEGYASEEAYLAIEERQLGQSSFTEVLSGLPISPSHTDVSWQWNHAIGGENYEVRALLKVRGNAIQVSSPLTISAPATRVVLKLTSIQQPLVATTTSISGLIHLDGYIPASSSVSLVAKPLGKTSFQTILKNMQAKDNQTWKWNEAKTGQTYLIQALLQSLSGTTIATSTVETVTAPSTSQLLTIHSTASPTAQTTSGITGSITLNGSIPANSYITIATRETGTSSFTQVLTTTSATNGMAWTLGNATTGKTYDVQAYLWNNNAPFTQSDIVKVTAPSQGNVLTINAQQILSAPASDTLNVSCGGQDNGQFQASINYNTRSTLSTVYQYTITVSLASSGAQVFSTITTPTSPNQPQTLTTPFLFIAGATYYVQYSYNTITQAQFSPFSSSLQFTCRS